MDLNGCVPSKWIGFQSIVAQDEMMILRLTGEAFNESVGEVWPPNERSSKLQGTSVTDSLKNDTRSQVANLVTRPSMTRKDIFYRAAVQKLCRKVMPSRPSARSWAALEKQWMMQISGIAKEDGRRNCAAGEMVLKFIKRRVQYSARRDLRQLQLPPGSRSLSRIRTCIYRVSQKYWHIWKNHNKWMRCNWNKMIIASCTEKSEDFPY